jgi:hypothetical protein
VNVTAGDRTRRAKTSSTPKIRRVPNRFEPNQKLYGNQYDPDYVAVRVEEHFGTALIERTNGGWKVIDPVFRQLHKLVVFTPYRRPDPKPPTNDSDKDSDESD